MTKAEVIDVLKRLGGKATPQQIRTLYYTVNGQCIATQSTLRSAHVTKYLRILEKEGVVTKIPDHDRKGGAVFYCLVSED